MKKCSYCGVEYPDDAAICAIDNNPLIGETKKALTRLDRKTYGGFWIRFAAYFMDVAVMLIPSLLISYLLHSVIPATNEKEIAFVNVVDDGFNLLIWWVYTSAFLSSSWQATPGKRICRLKVVDYEGGRISFGRATGRYFAGFLSVSVLGIGFLMIAWTARRQGLHDMIVSTLVVKTV